MKNFLKVLFVTSISVVLVSCGGNSASEEAAKETSLHSQIGVKEGAFYAISENIELIEHKLKEIAIHTVDCDAELTGLICEELRGLLEVDHLLFVNEDLIEKSKGSYKVAEGEVLLAGIHSHGTLRYSVAVDSGEFLGELTFQLKDKEIVVYIKGMI